MGSARKEGRRAFRAILRRISRFSRSQTSISSACSGQEVEDHLLRFGEPGQRLVEEGFVEAEELLEGGFPERPVEGEPLQEELREGALLLAAPRGKRDPLRREILDKQRLPRAPRGSAERRSLASSPSSVRTRNAPAIRARFSTAQTPSADAPGSRMAAIFPRIDATASSAAISPSRSIAAISASHSARGDEEPLLGPVEEILRRPGGVARRRPLELCRERCDQRIGDARPEPGGKEDLLEELLAETGGLSGDGRVVLVHVGVGLPPDQAVGEGGGRRGRRLGDADLPAPDLVEESVEILQVEFILEAGAPRLQEDGKIGVGEDRVHELLRPEPVRARGGGAA